VLHCEDITHCRDHAAVHTLQLLHAYLPCHFKGVKACSCQATYVVWRTCNCLFTSQLCIESAPDEVYGNQGNSSDKSATCNPPGGFHKFYKLALAVHIISSLKHSPKSRVLNSTHRHFKGRRRHVPRSVLQAAEVHEGPGPPDIGEGNLAEPFQLSIGGIISGRPACGSCVPESIWRKEVQRMVRQLPVFVLTRLCAIATGLVRPHVSPMLEKGILPSPPSLA